MGRWMKEGRMDRVEGGDGKGRGDGKERDAQAMEYLARIKC